MSVKVIGVVNGPPVCRDGAINFIDYRFMTAVLTAAKPITAYMKETIAILFFLLSMTALILLIIGFFNPGRALFWYNKSRTKKNSILINGLIFLITFSLCAVAMPPSAKSASAKEDLPSQANDKKSDATSTEAVPVYEVVKKEKNGDDTYLKITLADLYTHEALIEETRQLKEQYKSQGKLACYFYYKKYTDKTTPVAGTLYLEDCSHCEFKDKNGDPIDFPFYHLEKPLADSLLALRFDTTGYQQEAVFLDPVAKSRNIIFSSGNGKALHIMQFTTGHTVFPLIKKITGGEERFYDPEEKDSYYIINRAEGLVDYYEHGQLNLQQVIEL
jgi:hypothetical protein